MGRESVNLTEQWAISSFDPWDARLDQSNIWPLYAAIRREPIGYSIARGGFWLISRYADVRRVATDHDTFRSGQGIVIGQTEASDPPGAPLEYDPPEHTRIRAVMYEPFRGRAAQQFSEIVAHHVNRLLDIADQAGAVDIVTDIAQQLPLAVISDVIGFDDDARERNRELSLSVIESHDKEDMFDARAEYMTFLRAQIRQCMSTPRRGFLGELANMHEQGPQFTERELLGIVFSLGLAGHHSTSNALASMLIRAADEQARQQWLKSPADLQAINTFIEEVLRIDPPIHLEARRAVVPARVGEMEIPAGEQLALLYASGNHDELRFDDPERFAPGRGAGHFSFGHGIHVCLGMSLARMEMVTLLRELVRRFPRFQLEGHPVSSGMVFGHHMGWKSVPARMN